MASSELDDIANRIEQACARQYVQGLLDAAKRCERMVEGEEDNPARYVAHECAKEIRLMATEYRFDAPSGTVFVPARENAEPPP